jgi:uncharacterized protein DUF5684
MDETQVPSQQISPVFGVVYFALIIFMIVAWWRLFTKAGQPGWASIIPIFNTYILCKIAGKSGWWVLLLLIPCVGLVFWILVCIAVAERFGKGGGFAVGLILLPFIFFPILAFGDAKYQGGPPALA